jgi:hypothetical protein
LPPSSISVFFVRCIYTTHVINKPLLPKLPKPTHSLNNNNQQNEMK